MEMLSQSRRERFIVEITALRERALFIFLLLLGRRNLVSFQWADLPLALARPNTAPPPPPPHPYSRHLHSRLQRHRFRRRRLPRLLSLLSTRITSPTHDHRPSPPLSPSADRLSGCRLHPRGSLGSSTDAARSLLSGCCRDAARVRILLEHWLWRGGGTNVQGCRCGHRRRRRARAPHRQDGTRDWRLRRSLPLQ
jgi:hypothetical protein